MKKKQIIKIILNIPFKMLLGILFFIYVLLVDLIIVYLWSQRYFAYVYHFFSYKDILKVFINQGKVFVDSFKIFNEQIEKDFGLNKTDINKTNKQRISRRIINGK